MRLRLRDDERRPAAEVDDPEHAPDRLVDRRDAGSARRVGVDDDRGRGRAEPAGGRPRSRRRSRPGTTITASTLALAHLREGVVLGRSRHELAVAAPRTPSRSCADAGEPSSSTQPSVSPLSPPPWKMNPNMKMKISGKASVQNSAARSRT